ncbi:MAG: hypothetical protein O2925_04010 [Actinomycetota bacterium]|nr:hypothetical protein [Actinomycetota bacterium]MDA3015861.1 hypothetical protein [Actinomycetota bacterium]MDA3027941.1 hypothetical protein [Actinomycetota bacterium]
MRMSLSVMVSVMLLSFLTACDSGDGRDLKEPSVPYVAPTDPTTTLSP